MSLCVASGLADRSFFPDASSLTKFGVELEQPTKSVTQRIGITRRMVPPLRVGSFGEIGSGNCSNQGCRAHFPLKKVPRERIIAGPRAGVCAHRRDVPLRTVMSYRDFGLRKGRKGYSSVTRVTPRRRILPSEPNGRRRFRDTLRSASCERRSETGSHQLGNSST